MNNELVSIIMPAYNAEKYINESINSVIGQTYTNWELIIINDGSTDNTKIIAEKYTAADHRIMVINQDNKRLGAARNTGISNARGAWIAFLDADDLWIADKLEKQLLFAGKAPNVGVLFTDGYTFHNDTLIGSYPYGTMKGFLSAETIYKLQYKGNHIPVLSVIVKKQYVETVGLQDETPSIFGCEDWDYWLRLALAGVLFYGMPEKLFYYRRHSTNMSKNENLIQFAKANVFIKNFRPECFSFHEITALKNFIMLTICKLIKAGDINKAVFLSKGLKMLSGSRLSKLSAFLIKTFKRYSYYLVRSVFKVNRLINNATGNV